MIDFKLNDDCMATIAKLTGMMNKPTKNIFRIYGLAYDGNPPILFSVNETILTQAQEKIMADWLTTNGIDCAVEDTELKNKKIYIGLRRDLRNHHDLCSRLIQTFVNFIEGEIDIDPKFKVENIPPFKTGVQN